MAVGILDRFPFRPGETDSDSGLAGSFLLSNKTGTLEVGLIPRRSPLPGRFPSFGGHGRKRFGAESLSIIGVVAGMVVSHVAGTAEAVTF